jgi:hypothetical protein
VDAAGTSDPDIHVFSRDTRIVRAISAVNNVETTTRTYNAGTYVLTVFDDANASADGTGIDKCFNVEAK